MNTIISPIPADALDANTGNGRTLDRTGRVARRNERLFLRHHSGIGARTLYRIVSALG